MWWILLNKTSALCGGPYWHVDSTSTLKGWTIIWIHYIKYDWMAMLEVMTKYMFVMFSCVYSTFTSLCRLTHGLISDCLSHTGVPVWTWARPHTWPVSGPQRWMPPWSYTSTPCPANWPSPQHCYTPTKSKSQRQSSPVKSSTVYKVSERKLKMFTRMMKEKFNCFPVTE